MDVSPVVLAALESSDLCRRLVDESGQPLLTSAALIQLASKLQWLERSGGEVLFRQGENGQSAYILVQGEVEGTIAYAGSSGSKVFRLGAGELVGEMSLLTGLPRTATVMITTATQLLEISTPAFACLLALHPQIPEVLATFVSEREGDNAADLENAVEACGRNTVLTKFLNLLLSQNCIPKSFPQIVFKSSTSAQERIVAGLQASELYKQLRSYATGHPLLKNADLLNLAAQARLRQVRRGEIFFRQGEPGTSAFILISGEVEGEIKKADSRHIGEFQLQAGALFGEMSLLTGQSRVATLRAVQSSEVIELSELTFAHLLAIHPDIPLRLAEFIAQRQSSEILSLEDRSAGDRSVQDFNPERLLQHFQNLSQRVFGLYARVPHSVLTYLSSIKSEKSLSSTVANLYLTNNFAPVRHEIDRDNLVVIGRLPPELTGMFLRNGPNPQFPPLGRYHWFDGDGMVHGVLIEDGKALYRNRYVRTAGFLAEQQEGKAIWPGILNLPRFDYPHGILIKNVANTSLVWHNRKLLALWEVGGPYLMDFPSLNTLGSYSFDQQVSGGFTAHPKIDPDTGEMLFLSYSVMDAIGNGGLQYGVFSSEGKLIHLTAIELPRAVMMHDFAITKNYTIILDMPLLLRPAKVMRGEAPLEFDPQYPSRFGILPRYGDNRSVRWFEVPPCMIFHTANAYEVCSTTEGDEIVLLGCRSPYTNVLQPHCDSGELFDRGELYDSDEFRATSLYRWRFNLGSGRIRVDPVDDLPVEFPRIDERRLGRYSRYVYAGRLVNYMLPHGTFDGVVKYDLEQGTKQVHELGRARFCGEAVFVPRSDSSKEDQGWLLTYVHDAVLRRSELLLLDAEDLQADPVARILLPQRVPYGFHSTWVPCPRRS